MSYTIDAFSLRVGKSSGWKYNNIFFKNFSSFPIHFDLLIMDYFKGIIRSFTISDLYIKTFFYKKAIALIPKGKLKVPVLLGKCTVNYKHNSLYVYLNYYCDHYNSTPKKAYLLKKRLKSSALSLSKLLGVKLLLLDFNCYNATIQHIRFSPKKKNASSYNYNRNLSYVYKNEIRILRRYKNNQYFFRVFNVLFCSFTLKNIDFNLISNAISFEFSNLRKQHGRYIKFLKSVLSRLYRKFYKKRGLLGLRMIVKGRLTPHNRDFRRTSKKVFNIGGFARSSDVFVYAFKTSKEAFTRYGAINITLYYKFKKKNQGKSIYFKSPYTEFENIASSVYYSNNYNQFFFWLECLNLTYLKKFKIRKINFFFSSLFKLLLPQFLYNFFYTSLYNSCYNRRSYLRKSIFLRVQVQKKFCYFLYNKNFFIRKKNFLWKIANYIYLFLGVFLKKISKYNFLGYIIMSIGMRVFDFSKLIFVKSKFWSFYYFASVSRFNSHNFSYFSLLTFKPYHLYFFLWKLSNTKIFNISSLFINSKSIKNIAYDNINNTKFNKSLLILDKLPNSVYVNYMIYFSFLKFKSKCASKLVVDYYFTFFNFLFKYLNFFNWELLKSIKSFSEIFFMGTFLLFFKFSKNRFRSIRNNKLFVYKEISESEKISLFKSSLKKKLISIYFGKLSMKVYKVKYKFYFNFSYRKIKKNTKNYLQLRKEQYELNLKKKYMHKQYTKL